MDAILHSLAAEIAAFYEQLPGLPVTAPADPQAIRAHLAAQFDLDGGMPLETLIGQVGTLLRRWNVQTSHPRYFGLFNPPAGLASVVADALAALYNPQLATWSHAPAANEIEQLTLRHVMRRLGLDPETGWANFTTGGAEANLSAVLVALTHHFPGYGDAGLRQAVDGQPVIYLSQEAHDSFVKIAHHTGLGRQALRTIPADERLRMDVAALAAQWEADQAAGHRPFLVVGTAGTTSAGVVDPLPALAAFCQERGLWFHVDAAWGGAAALSPRLRPAVAGIDQADSITCDAHKWFSVSMGAGMFFCRHRDAVASTFRVRAAYMPGEIQDTADYYTTTIQWSRRFIGLKLFMALAALGDDGLVARIEHQAAMGDLLRRELAGAGWLLLNDTPLPVVCFTHPRLTPDGMSALLDRIYHRGEVWISATRLRGRVPALRACITSPHTGPEDVSFLVQVLEETLAEVDGGQRMGNE